VSGRRFDEDPTLAQIALRVGAAFALTAAMAVGIFVVILLIAGTG
jgi:hypothetical protein